MQEDYRKGCECPSGFKGDGVLSCEGTYRRIFGPYFMQLLLNMLLCILQVY
jgi:hypothetical protein